MEIFHWLTLHAKLKNENNQRIGFPKSKRALSFNWQNKKITENLITWPVFMITIIYVLLAGKIFWNKKFELDLFKPKIKFIRHPNYILWYEKQTKLHRYDS